MIIIDFVLEVLGYSTARIVLPVLTFGKVRVQPISSMDAGYNWLGFKRTPEGGWSCEGTMAGWIGLIPWVIALIAILTLS